MNRRELLRATGAGIASATGVATMASVASADHLQVASCTGGCVSPVENETAPETNWISFAEYVNRGGSGILSPSEFTNLRTELTVPGAPHEIRGEDTPFYAAFPGLQNGSRVSVGIELQILQPMLLWNFEHERQAYSYPDEWCITAEWVSTKKEGLISEPIGVSPGDRVAFEIDRVSGDQFTVLAEVVGGPSTSLTTVSLDKTFNILEFAFESANMQGSWGCDVLPNGPVTFEDVRLTDEQGDQPLPDSSLANWNTADGNGGTLRTMCGSLESGTWILDIDSANDSVTVGPKSHHQGQPDVDEIDGSLPSDPDGDGVYEDLNGNGRADFDDVVRYFQRLDEPELTRHPSAYDVNGNGHVDFDDVVKLFQGMDAA